VKVSQLLLTIPSEDGLRTQNVKKQIVTNSKKNRRHGFLDGAHFFELFIYECLSVRKSSKHRENDECRCDKD